MPLGIMPVTRWYTEEFLKHFFLVLFGYTRAIVAERKLNRPVLFCKTNNYINRRYFVFQAIVKQVYQYALHMEFVDMHKEAFTGCFE